MPLQVAVLGEALAALAAFVRPLFEMHKNVVFAVAEFFETLTAHWAAENLVKPSSLLIQLVALDQELVWRLSFADHSQLIIRLLAGLGQFFILIAFLLAILAMIL